MKTCSKCKYNKSDESFWKNSTRCKDCCKDINKSKANKIKAANQRYYQKNKKIIDEKAKAYALANPDKVRSIRKKSEAKNKEKRKEQRKQRYILEPGFNKEYQKNYYSKEENREKRRIRERARFKKNSKEISKRKWQQRQARFEKNVGAKITHNLRASFCHAVKFDYKIKSVLKLLGCSISEFKNYIESQFTIGMTWENWGLGMDKWNLDHVIPTSSFDMTIEEDQKKCWHYSNFQPLWQRDNIAKSDILPCGKRASEIGRVGAQYISTGGIS